jgi:hypothetical protein
MHTQERDLMASGLIIMFSNLLLLIAAFKSIGVLIITVYHMLTGDVFEFLVVYVILLYGFATALFVLVHDASVGDLGGLDLSPNQVSMHITASVRKV